MSCVLIVGIKSIETGEFRDLSKADTLRVMAASHVILAVVLIGTANKLVYVSDKQVYYYYKEDSGTLKLRP